MGAMPSGTWAQSAAVPRIGYLSGGSLATDGNLLEAFRDGLKSVGYVDGRNVTVDVRWAEGRQDRVAALAGELVNGNPNVLVGVGHASVSAALKVLTSTIPIVFVTGVYPVEQGIVGSLARPAGNVTGMTLVSSSLEGKRLDLLHNMLANARSVALLVNPALPAVADRIATPRTARHLA